MFFIQKPISPKTLARKIPFFVISSFPLSCGLKTGIHSYLRDALYAATHGRGVIPPLPETFFQARPL